MASPLCWTVDQACEWLADEGQEAELATQFRANRVDGNTLLSFTEVQLTSFLSNNKIRGARLFNLVQALKAPHQGQGNLGTTPPPAQDNLNADQSWVQYIPNINTELVPRIKAYCLSGTQGGEQDVYLTIVQSLLINFSGVKIPLVEYPRVNYIPKSKYIKPDLPTNVKGTELDLRLVPYDVYEDGRQVETQVVQETLQDIQEHDILPYANPHVFLAGHAFGKTKSLFDIARKRYTLLLDMSAQGHVDILDMIEHFNSSCYQKRATMEEDCKYEIYLTLTARIICLHLLLVKETDAITPEHWRDLQLNRMISSSTILPNIHSYLRHQYKGLEGIQTVMKALTSFHHEKLHQRLIVAVDEANLLISNYPQIFSRPSDPSKQDHPIWSLVGSTISGLSSVAIIVAGTRIHLKDMTVLVSSLAKSGVAEGQQVRVKTNFRATTESQAFLLCNRLFQNMDADTKMTISKRLCVRSRYITTFADYLDKHSLQEPLSALDSYYEQLVSSIEPWSIGKLLQDLQTQHASQATFLQDVCRLVKIYLLAEGLLKNPDQSAIDWMAGGVCYIAKHENALTYKITEGIVIDAIQRFFIQQGFSLARFLASELLDNSLFDSASAGTMFDFIVAQSILEQSASNQRPSFFKHIPWASDSAFKFVSATHSDYESYFHLRNWHKVLLPQKSVGADLIGLTPPIEIRFANRTTLRPQHAVEVNENINKTLTMNMYSKKDGETFVLREGYAERLKKVLQWYTDNHTWLVGIIRVNVILPYAAETTATQGQHTFEPGRIRLLQRRIMTPDSTINFLMQEAIVDIDSSCIDMCKLFPHSVADLLRKIFPKTQIMQWQVETLTEPFTHQIKLDTSNAPLIDGFDPNTRVCQQCGVLYVKGSSSSIPYCKNDGIAQVLYYCSLCEVNKSKKVQSLPPPSTSWSAEMQADWGKFASHHSKFFAGNDPTKITEFFGCNYTGLIAGDLQTFTDFITQFPIPNNKGKKRRM
eukprot:Phypoly_transcript_01843.p1 GENE.Phypoly_transcript_01843~~Phypoly_transcript_01843.p1  ORF type:complete len:986 (+),score=72.15 Phypoly_transcript_01843:121-3078(+)